MRLAAFLCLLTFLQVPMCPRAVAQEKISLAEKEPALVQFAMRNRKFYGDPLTNHGSLGERSYLTDNWGGLRDDLVDNGIYSYFGVTQHFGGNISGGNDTKTRANGSADYMLWLDTGKAGLWSGGGVFLKGETTYATSYNDDVGSLVPQNFDSTIPNPDQAESAFSEFYLVQALGEKTVMAIGKGDLGNWADQNLFANNTRTQFLSTGLTNNPQLGAIAPYTTWHTWIAHHVTDEFTLIYTINTQDSSATRTDLDTVFNGNMVNSLQFQWSPKLFGLPGFYTGLAGYSSGEQPDFRIDPRHALDELLGNVPIQLTDGNHGFVFSGSQYLKTWGSGHQKGCSQKPSRPLGVGLFFRYGYAPQDRNVITQFASAGLGGYGGPMGRIHDNWGVGWAGSYISPDVREAISLVEQVAPWEHSIEAFYNFRVTPFAHLSFHVQVADQAIADLATSTALVSRLQIDF
ncbi:carbohydrate porin [Fuerstiella marisgermanici]|uniref:Carbohydrate-selective porin n=1 Tax=Fuerstiella marisgermanici TaxID=1891926 RepID=A0A1P8WBZ4_9PLAN|nr:carbohydrate porin [Fuerstiella marisgermanici]APZ91588.1 Carbohydrate-selective porin [Fuerstiella marisgermanici]